MLQFVLVGSLLSLAFLLLIWHGVAFTRTQILHFMFKLSLMECYYAKSSILGMLCILSLVFKQPNKTGTMTALFKRKNLTCREAKWLAQSLPARKSWGRDSKQAVWLWRLCSCHGTAKITVTVLPVKWGDATVHCIWKWGTEEHRSLDSSWGIYSSKATVFKLL